MDRNGKPNESDRVARHRNQMHEIALKKQISVIQREGRLLERELREITKVKKTLMQLREPIRKRIAQTEREEIEEQQAVNKATVLYGIPRQTKRSQKHGKNTTKLSHTREILFKSRESAKTNSRSTVKTDNKQKNDHSDCSTSLPSIKNHLASCLTISEVRGSNAKLPESRRPETSMTVPTGRRKSLTIPQPPSTSLGHRKEDRATATEASASLTMEETLRIKGKFRQIGHSIIATALLKGLRQRGQLTSEAIHNMHKPISFDEPENTQTEDHQQQPTSPGLKRFRSLTRKAINVNSAFKSSNKKTDGNTTGVSKGDDTTPYRKIAVTDDTAPFEKPENINDSSEQRRRKIGLGGIEHAVLLRRKINNTVDVQKSDGKSVRFTQEAWE